MAKINAASTVVLCLILASTWMPTSQRSEKPSPVARDEDVEFIRCEVCRKVAEHLYDQVMKKQKEKPPQKMTNDEVVQMAKNACNLREKEADWIRRIDIVQHGDKLELEDKGTEGICNYECRTIEKACQEVMKKPEFVPDYLNEPNPILPVMERYLCRNLSEACKADTPPVPKDWTSGEDFIPLQAKEAEVEKNSTPMEGMPVAPSMEMDSTDDKLNNEGSFGGKDDGEADDKKGQVSKEEESRKGGSKLTKFIHAGAEKTGKTVKRFAGKAFDSLKRWTGTKKPDSKKNSKTDEKDL